MTPTPPTPDSAGSHRRFVVGITGASGAAYAIRLLEMLLGSGCEVHLVVTEYGRRLLADEAGVRSLDLSGLLKHTLSDAPPPLGVRRWPEDAARWKAAAVEPRLIVHPNKDVSAVIASGGFLHDGMVIVPCTSTSLGALATGSGSNLLCRAAMVTLKERRRLVVCHRESPLSLIDIENMRALTLAGAIVCPTNPGFYLLPESIEDVVDFMVGKVLDLLGVEHRLETRWGGGVDTQS